MQKLYRQGDIELRKTTSIKFDSNADLHPKYDYYEIVKYFPNYCYGKDPKDPRFSNISASCLESKELCYTIAHVDIIRGMSKVCVLDVAERIRELTDTERYDFEDVIEYANAHISELAAAEGIIIKDPEFVAEYKHKIYNRNMNSCVEKFNFGKAIELLKEGKCVCREGWNSKNLFICKQIPCELNGNIIANIQSLPTDAKKILLARGTIDNVSKILLARGMVDNVSALKYTNQCLIINADGGRADSWACSVDDMFAEDWMLYTEN